MAARSSRRRGQQRQLRRLWDRGVGRPRARLGSEGPRRLLHHDRDPRNYPSACDLRFPCSCTRLLRAGLSATKLTHQTSRVGVWWPRVVELEAQPVRRFHWLDRAIGVFLALEGVVHDDRATEGVSRDLPQNLLGAILPSQRNDARLPKPTGKGRLDVRTCGMVPARACERATNQQRQRRNVE